MCIYIYAISIYLSIFHALLKFFQYSRIFVCLFVLFSNSRPCDSKQKIKVRKNSK